MPPLLPALVNSPEHPQGESGIVDCLEIRVKRKKEELWANRCSQWNRFEQWIWCTKPQSPSQAAETKKHCSREKKKTSSRFPPPILTLQKENYTNICGKRRTVKFPHDLWNMKARLGGFWYTTHGACWDHSVITERKTPAEALVRADTSDHLSHRENQDRQKNPTPPWRRLASTPEPSYF